MQNNGKPLSLISMMKDVQDAFNKINTGDECLDCKCLNQQF